MGLQLFIVGVGLVWALALLRRPSRRLRWYAAVSVLLVLGNLLYAGLYWPVFPAYLVIVGSVVVLARRCQPLRLEAHRRMLPTVVLCCALCVASLPGMYVLPLFRLPAPTGLYSVGTRVEHWVDPATRRELAVQIWYPAVAVGLRARYSRLLETKPMFAYWHWIRTNSYQDAPVAAGPEQFPLLLFGHMWGGRRGQDTFLLEDLASHGYVVASIDHPGNAAREELADGSVLRSDRAKALSNVQASGYEAIRAVWARELRLWNGDDEFVLNSLLSGRAEYLAGRLDSARVGAFGHSFGGAASMALLGLDPRVKSAIDFDGWTFEGLDHRTTEPVLFVYEGAGESAPKGDSVDDRLERADEAIVSRSLQAGGGARAYVQGAQHADFTDQTLVSPVQRLTYTGPIQAARARTIVRGLAVSFFDRTLRDQGDIVRYPEVRMVVSAKP